MEKASLTFLIITTALVGVGNIYFAVASRVSVADLAGVDADSNGLRDNVDDYIRQNFTDSRQRGAVTQYAKHVEREMLSRDHPEQAEGLFRDNDARNCMYFVFEDAELDKVFTIMDTVRDLLINSAARRVAYDQFNRNVPGGGYPGSKASIESCDFYKSGSLSE